MDVDLPKRRKLSHEVPSWVQQGSRHFISINVLNRGTTDLLEKGSALLEGFRQYETIGRWHVWVALIMPDHLHAILTFNLDQGIRLSLSRWKGYQAKQLGIQWQSDFFEHRIRNDQEFSEKADYIRMNPVRKGLVLRPDDWKLKIDKAEEDRICPSTEV